MTLPLRERVLNAYAAGFAAWWIAARFGCSRRTVAACLWKARLAGDPRAPYVGREKNTALFVTARRWKFRVYNTLDRDDLYDEFPDLPEITAPILPFGGRVPQSVADAP